MVPFTASAQEKAKQTAAKRRWDDRLTRASASNPLGLLELFYDNSDVVACLGNAATIEAFLAAMEAPIVQETDGTTHLRIVK